MVVTAEGKRKKAKAHATLKEGDGRVRVNHKSLNNWPEMPRMKIKEPLKLANDLSDEIKVKVNVNGGGVMGQAEAARMAIARALIEYSDDDSLKQKFLNYDRNMLVEDYRRTETRKPSQSSKGARHKRQKSYR